MLRPVRRIRKSRDGDRSEPRRVQIIIRNEYVQGIQGQMHRDEKAGARFSMCLAAVAHAGFGHHNTNSKLLWHTFRRRNPFDSGGHHEDVSSMGQWTKHVRCNACTLNPNCLNFPPNDRLLGRSPRPLHCRGPGEN